MLTTPTLLLNQKIAQTNIRRMLDKAKRNEVMLRPHFKTHQSRRVGKWYRRMGIEAITVSSVEMARYFADDGWEEITIAFPVSLLEREAINDLASRLERLCLLVVDAATVTRLAEFLQEPVELYIEIDTGAGRSGLLPRQTAEIEDLVRTIEAFTNLTFRGFYSHPGHSYAARSADEVRTVHEEVIRSMASLKAAYPEARISIGDTPCCSVADQFDGIDEITPGNFVFYDLMQVAIGSCAMENIAVALAAPVVATYPGRNEVILHGGAVHLSKDSLEWGGQKVYGLPVRLTDSGWEPFPEQPAITALSQEHGVMRCSDELCSTLANGDLVGILPVHSCLTANLMRPYQIIT